MAAIRYFVTDVGRAAKFYTTQLGFAIKQQEGTTMAALIRGDLTLWLSAMNEGSQSQSGGWNRVMIEVLRLETRVAELKAAGVPVPGDVADGPGGRRALIEDPDGNRIELLERAVAGQAARPTQAARPAPASRPLMTPPGATYEDDDGPPTSVKAAAGLFIIALLVGVLDATMQSWRVTSEQIPASGSPVAIVISATITVLFLVLIWNRQNWARWVFAVLTVLSCLAAVAFALLLEIRVDPIGAAFTVGQVALQAVAVACLFQGSANAWFRSK